MYEVPFLAGMASIPRCNSPATFSIFARLQVLSYLQIVGSKIIENRTKGVTLLCRYGSGAQARGHFGAQLWYGTGRAKLSSPIPRKQRCVDRYHVLHCFSADEFVMSHSYRPWPSQARLYGSLEHMAWSLACQSAGNLNFMKVKI